MIQTLIEPQATGIDLDNIEINWNEVLATKEESGRWSFKIPSLGVGRKIGFLVGLKLDAITEAQLRQVLEDPEPADDIRLDAQTSYSEYDENDNNTGKIVLAEIRLRDGDADLERYEEAIKSVIESSQNHPL